MSLSVCQVPCGDGIVRHVIARLESVNEGAAFEFHDPVTDEVVGSVGMNRLDEFVTPLVEWIGSGPGLAEDNGQAIDLRDGAELIVAERERQERQERWSWHHDDQHRHGELRQAAKAYASDPDEQSPPPAGWPWEGEWWKPSDDPIRNLVKAGALIAAEIDRLQRTQK